MLFISLVFSAVLLVMCNLAARANRGRSVGVAFVGFALVMASAASGCILPTVFLQALLLITCAICCGGKPQRMMWSTIGTTAAAYTLAGVLAYKDVRGLERMREDYPLESLEKRLIPPRLLQIDGLSSSAKQQLDELDNHVASEAERGSLRRWMLERLHHRTEEWFVNSPGFGVRRMGRPTEYLLAVHGRENVALAQPNPPKPLIWSESDSQIERQPAPPALADLHRDSVLDFVNPRGFGWVIPERRQVAGFQPHHFSQVPQSKEWRIHSVELVGLLVHDSPVVYQTANLPRMQDAKTAPTRSLNAFEALGLEHLQHGENFYVQEKKGDLRALGALRSGEQCQKCHGGELGDLLGAFSYQLESAN